MDKPYLLRQSRQSLDARFKAIGPVARFNPPVRGWIKAIRDALGMTTVQLARRMELKQPTIIAIEKSEARGTIQLATLRRVADAMDCTLVYALVPNASLEAVVAERARKVAGKRLKRVEHSMLLENQSVRDDDREAQISALSQSLKPRDLWDET